MTPRCWRGRSSVAVHLELPAVGGELPRTVCGVRIEGLLEMTEHDTARGLRPCVACDRMKNAATMLREGTPLPELFGGGVVDHGVRA